MGAFYIMPKKNISGGKVLLALCTGGLSLPLVGIKKSAGRKKKSSVKKTKAPSRAEIRSLKSRCRFFSESDFSETDLAESSDIAACCPKCAMYRRRIYSLTGKDRRFPKLPNDFDSNCCGLNLHPYIWGISEPSFHSKNPIAYSNRPFVDDRSTIEKENYQMLLKEAEEARQKELDKKIYQKLLSKLPDDAPKSFGAFRRMEKSNSCGYIALKQKAQQAGIDL